MSRYLMPLLGICLWASALRAVTITDISVCQRYPWNGLVDITVTLSGAENDVTNVWWSFAMTNKTTKTEMAYPCLSRNGKLSGSGTSWTQKFIWNALDYFIDDEWVAVDMVADIELSVEVKVRGSGGVQLWENGPYWAECNVGATNPEEFGYYFWWGDTVGYTHNANDDGWVSVKDGTSFSFTESNCPTYNKYNTALQSAGYIDSAGNLVAAHDAATAHLGTPWRMPTAAEIDKLISNCTTTWTNRNDVNGYLVTGKGAYASKSIFLPAAGIGKFIDLELTNGYGRYMSSTPSARDWDGRVWYDVAEGLLFNSDHFNRSEVMERRFANSVRPLRGFFETIGNVGASTTFRLSVKNNGARVSSGDETLRYSNLWAGDANATVTISQNGVALVEGLTGEGEQSWSVTRNGTYTLTHTTYKNGVVAKVENVTFVVIGKEVSSVAVTGVKARQRYPWNGLVDIIVTLSGEENDVANVEWSFAATNKTMKTEIAIASLTRNGELSGSGTSWTQKFIWNAPNDVADDMVADIELSVEAKVLGGVQLWKNGPYWAECNVGATKPEEYGYYFWWGDTVGYTRNANDDGWVSVKDGTSFSFTESNCPTYNKYNTALQSAGYIDSAGNLVAAHDAATAHLGTPWRMPTDAEFEALISNCTTTWTTFNGVYGLLVTGKGAYASKSIFLPAASDGDRHYFSHAGEFGSYWSSTPHSDNYSDCWVLAIDNIGFHWIYSSRHFGRPVRPLRGFAQ